MDTQANIPTWQSSRILLSPWEVGRWYYYPLFGEFMLMSNLDLAGLATVHMRHESNAGPWGCYNVPLSMRGGTRLLPMVGMDERGYAIMEEEES